MRQELRTVQGRFCFCWARSQGVGIIVTWSAFITGPREVSEDRSEAVSLRLCKLNWYYFLTLMWAIITTVTVQSWHDQLTGAASVYQSTTSSSSSWGMNAKPGPLLACIMLILWRLRHLSSTVRWRNTNIFISLSCSEMALQNTIPGIHLLRLARNLSSSDLIWSNQRTNRVSLVQEGAKESQTGHLNWPTLQYCGRTLYVGQ